MRYTPYNTQKEGHSKTFLGNGAFGNIYLITPLNNKQYILKEPIRTGLKWVKIFEQEYKIFKDLSGKLKNNTLNARILTSQKFNIKESDANKTLEKENSFEEEMPSLEALEKENSFEEEMPIPEAVEIENSFEEEMSISELLEKENLFEEEVSISESSKLDDIEYQLNFCKPLETKKNNKVKFAMEYIDGTKLEDTDLNIFDLLNKLVKGVYKIHETGYVHRDLKSDNILFDKNKNIKIIDFGTASLMIDKKSLPIIDSIQGNLKYMPPSVFNENSVLTPRRDMYAIGGIMLDYMAKKGIVPSFVEDPIGPDWYDIVTNIVRKKREDQLSELSNAESKVLKLSDTELKLSKILYNFMGFDEKTAYKDLSEALIDINKLIIERKKGLLYQQLVISHPHQQVITQPQQQVSTQFDCYNQALKSTSVDKPLQISKKINDKLQILKSFDK